jgi:hypothetical protein
LLGRDAEQAMLNDTLTGIIGDFDFNRARTSSTSSLPSFSNSAEDFGADNISSRFASQFGSVREESPVTGLADVFREPGLGNTGSTSSSGGIATTDSFGESRIQALSDSFGESNRSRAATWGEPSTSMFGPGLIGGSPDFLADGLASILKLSGAEEMPERPLYPPPGL